MTDEIDPYLWQPDGTPTREIVELERRLSPLAWAPRALAPPTTASPTPRTKPVQTASSGFVGRTPDRRTWVPALAGLVAAAAVLTAIVWLRDPGDEPATPFTQPSVEPLAEPAGRPSPDLRDPFADDTVAPPNFAPPAPAGELVDPFGGAQKPEQPTISPNLKDPFSARTDPPRSDPKPKPVPHGTSPDLVDPFADSGEREPRPDTPQKKPSKLTDPFGGKPSEPSEKSPDLHDPFSR